MSGHAKKKFQKELKIVIQSFLWRKSSQSMPSCFLWTHFAAFWLVFFVEPKSWNIPVTSCSFFWESRSAVPLLKHALIFDGQRSPRMPELKKDQGEKRQKKKRVPEITTQS